VARAAEAGNVGSAHHIPVLAYGWDPGPTNTGFTWGGRGI
jgi:hypothetical protein